jgi:hypothetical protein
MRLHIWFAISLIMATAAIVSVFTFIPFVSAYAFWIATTAWVLLASSHRRLF